MVTKFLSEFTSQSRNMSRTTRSKTALNEDKNKDPNAGIFTDTSRQVSETYYLDWSWIYVIFDNDNFTTLSHDQSTYTNISKS